MRRDRQKKSKKKIFLLCSVLFVTVFMGLGFSYFSDTITFEGTTNLFTSRDYLWYQLINDIQPSSLLAVPYETGKYAFVGSDPDNYIQIMGANFRIISVEADHTIKIVLPYQYDTAYDSVNNRTSASTYCTDLEHGCNSWAAQSLLTNGTISGSVENSSTVLNYINAMIAQANIDSSGIFQEHAFNIGDVSANATLSSIASQEQTKTWTGMCGTITLSELLFAEAGNVNATLGSAHSSFLSHGLTGGFIWTMNPLADDSSKVWTVTPSGTQEAKYVYLTSEEISSSTYNYGVLPTFYLKANVKLDSGTGTASDPYILQ